VKIATEPFVTASQSNAAVMSIMPSVAATAIAPSH
jgi:hypothetical protein